MTIAKILAEMAAARPADQFGQEEPTTSLVPEPVQDVDGSQVAGNQPNRPADQKGNTLDVQPVTPVADPVGAIQQGQGTEVQGNTYGTPFAEAFAAKLAGSAEFKVDTSAVKGLMESQDLSEEFVAQAVEIFESAIGVAVNQHLEKVNAYAAYVFESLFEAKCKELDEEVEGYLNHVVAEWAQENKLAIEEGVRSEVAESFMQNLKNVFEEHYVDLPEAKKDLYVESQAELEAANAKLEEAAARELALAEEISTLKKKALIEQKVAGMTAVAAQRVRDLAEGLEFQDQNSFEQKLNLLSEATSTRVGRKPVVEHEDVHPVVVEQERPVSGDPEVAALARSISRFAPRK